MAFFIILCLCLIIYALKLKDLNNRLKNQNENLKRQIERLKQKLLEQENKDNYINNQILSEKIIDDYNLGIINKKEEKHELEYETNISPPKISMPKQKTEKELQQQKNTSILVTGSILIILSALVFLMSTWSIIPNILKTIVIMLFVGIFFGASKIAKSSGLEKASKAFYAIAMAYIPIGLLSCSIFGLFGTYFSFVGEGNFIYFTLSSLITSLIYLASYKTNKSKQMLIVTILAQLFSVVMFSLVFGKNIYLTLIFTSIYSLAIILAQEKIKDLAHIELFIQTQIYLTTTFTLFCAIILIITQNNSNNVLICILLSILALTHLTLYAKGKQTNLNSIFFSLIIYEIGAFLISQNKILDETIKIGLISIYLFIVNILLNSQKQNQMIKQSSNIIGCLFFTIVTVFSYIIKLEYPYLVLIANEVFLIYVYTQSNDDLQNILSLFIPLILTIIGTNIIYTYSPYIIYCVIYAIIVYIIAQIIRYLKIPKLDKTFNIISQIYLILTYFLFVPDVIFEHGKSLVNIIMLTMIPAIYFLTYILNEKVLYKYLTYITTTISCVAIEYIFYIDANYILLTPTIAYLIFTILEQIFNLKDNISDIFFIFYELLAYICLANISNIYLKIITSVILTIYIYIRNIKTKKINLYNIIPLACMIPIIFTNDIEFGDIQYIPILISQIILITIQFAYMLYKKELTVETFFSFFYIILATKDIQNIFVVEFLILAWAILNYIIFKKGFKDIFKLIIFIDLFCIYVAIIDKLEIELISITLIGIALLIIGIFKTIIQKYINKKTSNLLLVFALVILNLVSLFLYTSQLDGMIYVLFTCFLLIFSYIAKYSETFFICILTILLNVFALTRKFWFSIPWWIYLLVIGCALIWFAINNEQSQDEDKKSLKDHFLELKDKIEK